MSEGEGMRAAFKAWEAAQAALVQIRADPQATDVHIAAAVRRAGETLSLLLRQMVGNFDAMRRTIDRIIDRVSEAIEAGDEDNRRMIADIQEWRAAAAIRNEDNRRMIADIQEWRAAIEARLSASEASL